MRYFIARFSISLFIAVQMISGFMGTLLAGEAGSDPVVVSSIQEKKLLELKKAIGENNHEKVISLLDSHVLPDKAIFADIIQNKKLVKTKQEDEEVEEKMLKMLFKSIENTEKLQEEAYSVIKNVFDQYQALLFDLISGQDNDEKTKTLIAARKNLKKYLVTYFKSSTKNANKIVDLIVTHKNYEFVSIIFQEERDLELSQLCEKIKNEDILPPLVIRLGELEDFYGDAFALSFINNQEKSEVKNISFDYGHVPLLWLVDNFSNNMLTRHYINTMGCDKQFWMRWKTNDPVHITFLMAVYFNDFPIVASKALTCLLLTLTANDSIGENPEKIARIKDKLKDRVKNVWQIYEVPDSQFCVWVPKFHEKQSKDLFNISDGKLQLKKDFGEDFIKNSLIQFCPRALDHPDKYVHPYDESDLIKIFKSRNKYQDERNKRAIIDIMLMGHGRAGESVASIPVSTKLDNKKRISSLLSYINDNLFIGTVTIMSCSTGVTSRSMLKEIGSGIPIQFNYNLILEAISDKPTLSIVNQSNMLLKNYFANAAKLSTGEITIDKLCKDLTVRHPSFSDIHGFATTPQVLIPNTQVFEGCNIADIAFQGSKKIISENRPITIQDKAIALWYTHDIMQKITVYPTTDTPVMYPEFILMDKRRPFLHFGHIHAMPGASKEGIFHFISDAFLDVGEHSGKGHTIFINKLEGINDLFRPIEKMTEIKTDDKEIAKSTWDVNRDEQIVIENVVVHISDPDTSLNRVIKIFLPMQGATDTVGLYTVSLDFEAKTKTWRFATVSKSDVPRVDSIKEMPLSRFAKIRKYVDIEIDHSPLHKLGTKISKEEREDSLLRDIAMNRALDRILYGRNKKLFANDESKKELLRAYLSQMANRDNEKNISPPPGLTQIEIENTFEEELSRAIIQSRKPTKKVVKAKMSFKKLLSDLSIEELQKAIKVRDVQKVKNILEVKDIGLNQTNILMDAVKERSLEIVALLLKHGAKVDLDKLIKAINTLNDTDVNSDITLLLIKELDYSIDDLEKAIYRRTPFINKIVKRLLDYELDLNATTSRGQTLLEIASLFRDKELIKMLNEARLEMAVNQLDLETFKDLLKMGAWTTRYKKIKESPLYKIMITKYEKYPKRSPERMILNRMFGALLNANKKLKA